MATGVIKCDKTAVISGGGVECVQLGVISANGTKTLTFSTNVRAILVIISGVSAQNGMYTIYGGTGTVVTKAISASSVITLDTGTSGKLKITSTAALRAYVLVLEGNGGFTVS